MPKGERTYKKRSYGISTKAKSSIQRAKRMQLESALKRQSSKAKPRFIVWAHNTWQPTGVLAGQTVGLPCTQLGGYGDYATGTINTTLQAFPGLVAVAAVTQRYRILKMRVSIAPIYNVADPEGTGGGNQGLATISAYVDPDNLSSATPNPAQVMSHPDGLPVLFCKPFIKSFVPGVSVPVETATPNVTTSSQVMYKQWIQTAQLKAEIDGLKYAIWSSKAQGTTPIIAPDVSHTVTVSLQVEFEGLSYQGQPDIAMRAINEVLKDGSVVEHDEHDGETDVCVTEVESDSDDDECTADAVKQFLRSLRKKD